MERADELAILLDVDAVLQSVRSADLAGGISWAGSLGSHVAW